MRVVAIHPIDPFGEDREEGLGAVRARQGHDVKVGLVDEFVLMAEGGAGGPGGFSGGGPAAGAAEGLLECLVGEHGRVQRSP